jgi:hypothetical protein
MNRFPRWAAAAALAAACAWAPKASAAIPDNSGTIELFAGWYNPEENVPSQDLADWTYGVRGGINFTPHFLFQGGVQRFTTDYDTLVGTVDIEQWMADLSFGWLVNPDNKATFLVYGGPGYAWTNTDFPTIKDADDNSFSAHVGVGGIIQIGKSFYLRPDARYRWIDGDNHNDDRGDWEATFGFGWLLGGATK